MKGWIIYTRALSGKDDPDLYFCGGIPLPRGPSICLSPERANAFVFVAQETADTFTKSMGHAGTWQVIEIEASIVPPETPAKGRLQ